MIILGYFRRNPLWQYATKLLSSYDSPGHKANRQKGTSANWRNVQLNRTVLCSQKSTLEKCPLRGKVLYLTTTCTTSEFLWSSKMFVLFLNFDHDSKQHQTTCACGLPPKSNYIKWFLIRQQSGYLHHFHDVLKIPECWSWCLESELLFHCWKWTAGNLVCRKLPLVSRLQNS